MNFSIYNRVNESTPRRCTQEVYIEMSNSEHVREICKQIAAAEGDKERQSELKRKLPVVTWQAEFAGRRVSAEAKPSGLFMLDIDHVDKPFVLYSERIAARIKEFGIMYVGMTASRHGLRVVAKCRKEYSTIAECQQWLAHEIGVEFDDVCKDWARSSFLVDDSYTYYMDGKIFSEEPEEGTVYEVVDMPTAASMDDKVQEQNTVDYKGIPYTKIVREWLERNGGVVVDGERNARLYKLATRLKYICDFDEERVLKNMPTFGLDKKEMRQIVHNAIGGSRSQDMPKDLQDVLIALDMEMKLGSDDEEDDELITDTSKLPPLPPVIKQWVECAPDDFKAATVFCQLPILGALGSRLRGRYLDGKMHSPSFQVSLEAPQASGKSFITRIADYELGQMKQYDNYQREVERAYMEKMKDMSMLKVKLTPENKKELLGEKPKTLIRYCPAKMSITKLLMRMENAKGLHLFSVDEEIDTVQKAYKSSFSNLSDLLRKAFDNSEYGQEFASENSISTITNIYYNTLFSGTPKAMRRFYPDVEDGLVSRVCFVTLPDQFGKPMPLWKELEGDDKTTVDIGLVRLNDISIIGDEVQPEHEVKLGWLNEELEKWIKVQQAEAVRMDDRTRDTFCRRSAVVGFRAGMLAYFLYGEKRTPTIVRNVRKFAVWVANYMLNQHLLRFKITTTHSNINRWEGVYAKLSDIFTREDLKRVLLNERIESSPRVVIYHWRLLGIIKGVGEVDATPGRKSFDKYEKVK